MAQEQTKRGGGGGDDDDVTGSTAAGQERREKLTEDTDDLLDEIDDVLEENAEDFVRAYVQTPVFVVLLFPVRCVRACVSVVSAVVLNNLAERPPDAQ